MHMGHLQSTIIGDALDNVLEYSGVRVRRRFYYGDYLDIVNRLKKIQNSNSFSMKTKRQDLEKDREEQQQKQHSSKPDERCYFSDLTEEQLMPSFGELRKFRFVLCKVFLSYNSVDAKARRVYKRHLSTVYTYDLPNDTDHGTVVGSGHQLFGSIQAAGFSLDPASPPFNIFNRQFNDPIAVSKLGCLSPHCICYCSIPFSTSVKIAAKLYVTTDNMVDMNTTNGYYTYFRCEPEQFNDAFEICNDSAVINLSDYFANRPNGGSCSYTLNGRDGYLKLCYVALKYVVDAALEVVFHATSEETKVAGRVMAYYGKNFDYGCSPAEVDDYKAMLFESKQPEVKPGKINLMRPVLSVPAQFSLIIDANLTDSTSGAIILSGVYEFFVPTDGGIRVGCIKGNDCSLELTVDWKLPPFSEETTLAKRSYYSDLTEKQVFPQSSSVTKDVRKKWVDGSLQKEISLAFGRPVNGSFRSFPRKVSVSISTGTEADDCDYLCTSVLNIWPEIRSRSGIDGPKRAGLAIKDAIDDLSQAGMLERCVVGGPGFLKFKLSKTWIAESIFKMLESGILTWAPKLPIETTIIHILPRNIAKKMHMGHLQSTIIGDALANVLEYSGVRVRRRFHYGDYLDIESKMMMTEFLIDRFPNGEVNDQAIGELEVLYENSKKRFAEDAEFRERTQPVRDWDDRHKSAWEQICKISRERYRKVYLRLGICVKEEGKTLHDHYIGETRKLLREKGYNTEVEGDEVIVIEGRKLRLVDFAAFWHSLEIGKADRIVHVADVGQRDKIEMCIT
ncbi:anticodon-binding aminoacyl-tRNA synthetase, class 1a, partial [Tanacetum coccineum]